MFSLHVVQASLKPAALIAVPRQQGLEHAPSPEHAERREPAAPHLRPEAEAEIPHGVVERPNRDGIDLVRVCRMHTWESLPIPKGYRVLQPDPCPYCRAYVDAVHGQQRFRRHYGVGR